MIQRPENRRRLTRWRTTLDYRAYPHGPRTSAGAGTAREARPTAAPEPMIRRGRAGPARARAPAPDRQPRGRRAARPRADAEDTAQDARAEAPELKDGIYAIVPGVGTIELNSAQIGMHRRTTSPVGRSTSREAAAPPTEIVVTSHLGDHSDKIFRSSVEGETRDRGDRFIKGGKPYLTIKIHRATDHQLQRQRARRRCRRQADRVLDVERHEDRVRGRAAPTAGSPPA